MTTPLPRLPAALALACGLLLAVGCTPRDPPRVSGTVDPKSDAPNVLLFVTDDQRVDTLSVMPQTRRWFRAGGTQFKPGFVTTPLCCPSRASIMSGRFTHNHKVTNNLLSHVLDFPHTLPSYLQKAGYRTGMVGRFLNSWRIEDPPPFFEYFAMSQRNTYVDGVYNVNGNIRQIDDYSTHVMSEHAVRFLRHDDNRPWFLMVTPVAPHAPSRPEPRYAREPVPDWDGNPATLELDVRDKPAYVQSYRLTNDRSEKRAQQLRTLMSVDDLVGRVRAQLMRQGEMRKTLAFFISDNGVNWGEHGLDGKGTPYRPAVEVPFFMAWPDRVANGLDDRMAASIDIAPTVLDAAGIEPDPDVPMDGRSLLEEWRRKELLLEYQFYATSPSPSWASLRSRSRQYIEYYKGGAVTFRELYDLRADPWQLDNLSDELPDVRVKSLHRRLSTYRSCSGSDCW
jgi:arylsulfatase A-like enzyme